jgi:hypothetical protein
MPSGEPFKITPSVLKRIHKLITTTDLSLKEIGFKIGFGSDTKPMDSTSKVFQEYIKSYGKPDPMRLQTRGVKLNKNSPYVKNVIKLRKELGSTQAVAQKLGKENKTIRNVLSKFAPQFISPANPKGPETSAKVTKRKRVATIKALEKELKALPDGPKIFKEMKTKLKKIKDLNTKILNMSDEAILKSRNIREAMNLNVAGLKIGEGITFDRYKDLSKKEFVKKVRSLARKGEFAQPEHIIPIRSKQVAALLPENIFPAFGKVGGQMDVLKDFSAKNPIGERSSQVFEFLKRQKIPIEKPGLLKAIKTAGTGLLSLTPAGRLARFARLLKQDGGRAGFAFGGSFKDYVNREDKYEDFTFEEWLMEDKPEASIKSYDGLDRSTYPSNSMQREALFASPVEETKIVKRSAILDLDLI